MNETTKTLPLLEENGILAIMKGRGIDVGCGHDPIKIPGCTTDPWDMILGHGDAFTLPGVENDKYDWLFSSHCLEDAEDVPAALKRWGEVIKPRGTMVITVPDWIVYERCQWPSRYNGAHKASFIEFLPIGWPRPSHQFFTSNDICSIAVDCGLRMERCDAQFQGYDFTRLWDLNLDQTRGSALAQNMFVFTKQS